MSGPDFPMPSQSRIGNSIFFIGLTLLALAAIVYSMSEGNAGTISAIIGGASLLLMVIGGWLWNKPDHKQVDSLSRQTPRLKLLALIPGLLLVCLPVSSTGRELQFLGFALLAVAFVGALELLLDRKWPSAKDSWERLAAWKKIGISMVVIAAALFVFGAAAMFIARSI